MYKVVVAVKVEETISTEATVQVGEIFKAEAIIKEEDKVEQRTTQNIGKRKGKGQYQGRGRCFSQIVCRRCNKVDHYAEDCRTSIDKIPKFHQNTAQFANDQVDHDSSEYVFTNT